LKRVNGAKPPKPRREFMRKKLFLIMFSIIFITATVISLLIGSFSYNFVKTVLRENREEQIYRIEKQLDEYQSLLDSIENSMNQTGKTALLEIAKNYPSSGAASKASPLMLQKLAEKLKVGHIYFINSTGIVFNSSLTGDVGLNLLGLGGSFNEYLNAIYGNGEVISQGISVSTHEGKINHYMYYSPKGSKMIYEISFDVIDYVNKKYNFALYEFIFGDMFKNFYNEYLHSMDIYSIVRSKGWSLINSGKRMDASPEIIKKLLKNENVVIESGNKIYVYKKMKMNRYFFNRSTNVYFELIYDVSPLNKYIKQIFLYSLFLVIMITLSAFFISTRKLNSIFIKRIMNIIDGLKLIRYGNYDTVISDNEKDEISDIATNINQLIKTIKNSSAELNLSNEELRELTLYVNDIIESMPSIIITLDADERIIHWNKEAEKFSGYSSTESVGRVLWDFIPEFSRYKIKCDEVRINGVTVELLKEIFYKEECGIEETFIKNIFIFPFSKKDITGVIIRVDDITELEKKEERLNRASRVEALGTMAGGLAHDFNNIISGIISTASYLDMIIKDNCVDENEILIHLDIIKQSGGKAAQLVKNLMSVSKNETDNFSRVNLEQIVKDVLAITKSTVPVNVECAFINNTAESYIKGSRSQLEQVILNLVVNASEAIKISECNEPVISLLLDSIEPDSKVLSGFKGLVWHISIADNGPGINRANLKKIFDPFYTTKSDGSGLGLAVVHNIVMRHNGSIEVHSEPGSGTVFDIYFPAFE